ncbi:MAG: response regulator transcription factor [Saprospiraceae bacterium]
MKYTCLIVDDEPIAHEILKDYLSKFPALELIGQFYNTANLEDYLAIHAIDILLLDIKMPGEDGLRFLERMINKPITILTTAYRDYALEGFDLGVIDYLVKPIKFERFQVAIERSIEFISLSSMATNLLLQDAEKKFITIKSGTKTIAIETKNISHIQGLKDYVIVYADGHKYVALGYMKLIEAILPPGEFQRVHKSFLVSKNRINCINKNKIEFDNFQIPIGRMYKQSVEKFLKK